MFSSCLSGNKKAKPPEAAPAAAPVSTPTTEAVSKEADLEIVVPTLEAKLIDPFAIRVPVVTRAEEPLPNASLSPDDKSKPAVLPPQPELEGIWIDPEMKVAFISGQAVRTGEKILGWTVTSISKEKVYLQKGSATKILKLEEK